MFCRCKCHLCKDMLWYQLPMEIHIPFNFFSYYCIISNRIDGIKYYTSKQNNCFKTLKELHKKNERPFYVALTERALNKGLPNNCKLIYNDNIKLNFSEQELVLSKFYECFN